ncbi:BEL1-like homeodomain protein 2 [Elaeis guineensis]|uniref:BEL1-like homeodomain protein 4 n=1 Tax=Elaeis guineensis var. tenera TaxID=51953 RepID=A0A6I9SEQ3_ELAGV|nr:BEL1-like homeodomain protein 4 [Elaeis guineensis]XP_010941776.1 BEL1-like homeodomain protein 4 [Elaeis guineensis]
MSPTSSASMSHGLHQRMTTCQEHDQMQHHIAQQSRRDKLRVQGFEATNLHPLDQIEDKRLDLGTLELARTGSILSNMFNFPAAGLADQISDINRLPPKPAAEFSGEWYGDKGAVMGGNFNSWGDTVTDSATMQLLLMNMPSQEPYPRSTTFGNGSFSGGVVENQGLSLSLSSSLHQLEMGGVSLMRYTRFARAATELLEEVCSVWREHLKERRSRRQLSSSNPNYPNPSFSCANGASSGRVGDSSSSPKNLSSLSSADKFEHQRKKAKLLSMLDEVDKRYNHYSNQMQMVINSFDSVMGFGAATPYTILARKAMSRHFRCLKDAINKQLKQVCELLGEKEAGSTSGISKGETPRLRLLEQNLRQRRPFHQIGIMDSEAWRPQRGLPERSVNVLRAWLFEHFLHPYPSDADKQQLARRTGLSRNQVSNWFINARVRLWKPMVEEMYQQEVKEEEEDVKEGEEANPRRPLSPSHHNSPQGQGPEANATGSAATAAAAHQSNDDTILMGIDAPTSAMDLCGADMEPMDDLCGAGMRLGATGDVSLTLGLRHAGNLSEKNWFYG